MLEFLLLLEKKMPAGFSVSIKRDANGFRIEFRHGRVYTHHVVNDVQLNGADLNVGARESFSQLIFEDMITKIRNHSDYAKA